MYQQQLGVNLSNVSSELTQAFGFAWRVLSQQALFEVLHVLVDTKGGRPTKAALFQLDTSIPARPFIYPAQPPLVHLAYHLGGEPGLRANDVNVICLRRQEGLIFGVIHL